MLARRFAAFCLSIAVSYSLVAPTTTLAADAPRKPNIVVFLADDMGFSDAGCYGGQVQTPNIDRLAAEGLRFTQFYNTARCWPSRAALLTGYYAQQVRRDTVPGLKMPTGGRGVRPAWATLLPDLLKPFGYRSYHSGKWHVDGKPLAQGFDHSYRLEDHNRNFDPRDHFEDDQPLPPIKLGTDFLVTTAIADHALKCLREHAREHADKPFFQYVAFTSPHFPLHAKPEDRAKYRGAFAAGWDVLRQARLDRLREQGIVTCGLSERTPGVPAWDSLSTEDQAMWQVRMELHAAMIDRMDQEIGRVLEQLRSMNALDDTLVMFMSDNGASAEKLVRGDGNDPTAPPGSAKTFLCIEPPWANVANTPLRLSKMFVHEGGIATPLVVRWPRGFAGQNQLRHQPSHLIDIVPTIFDILGSGTPEPSSAAQPPLPGRSLLPALVADKPIEREYLWWFHEQHRAVRIGDLKLVSLDEDGPWELYDLKADRAEMHDLASAQPDKVRELSAFWKDKLDEFTRQAASK